VILRIFYVALPLGADAKIPTQLDGHGWPRRWALSSSTRAMSMSHGQWRFKPSEIIRAVKSVKSTGLPVRNVEIARDGTIRVNVGEPVRQDEHTSAPSEWD
jgi:hypothetical protein